MKKEDLIAMGFTEEQADALISKYGTMIPKERFDEVNNAKKNLETQVSNYETQLNELKEKVDGGANLETEVTNLKNQLQQAKTEYEQQLQEERLNAVVKLSLAGKVQDVDIVASLLDKAKIELDDKGAIKGGLDEQLTTLKESKSFLFVPEKGNKQLNLKGVNPAGGTGGSEELSTGSQFAKEFNEKGKSASSDAPSLWV